MRPPSNGIETAKPNRSELSDGNIVTYFLEDWKIRMVDINTRFEFGEVILHGP